MSDPRQPPDELDLKKRARRRLVGAVAFATFAAVVLPMVMDETPPPVGRDIELRIPGQDQVISSPLTTGKPAAVNPANAAKSGPAGEAPVPAKPVPAPEPAAAVPVAPAAAPAPESTPRKAEAAPPAAKPPAKATPPAASAPPAKAADPAPKKESPAEAKRAQAILEAQPTAASEGAGAHVVLIGAFANTANVKNIQTKLGQLGIKTYTENLESPQGRKTRVRAGPFPNRDAAEKALEKMKRIGVGGVVAAKS